MKFSHEKFYYLIDFLSIVLYISIVVGLGFINPMYIDYFDKFVKLYISGYLMYRFFPYSSSSSMSITRVDQSIIFNAALYLMLSIIPFDKIIINKFHKKIDVDNTKII